jgi:hypothetical protein
MFHSIRRLLDDLRILMSNKNGTNGQEGSLGADEKPPDSPLPRVIAQLGLTLFVIGICAYVVRRPEASETSIRLAHTGFGIIMGYWFR